MLQWAGVVASIVSTFIAVFVLVKVTVKSTNGSRVVSDLEVDAATLLKDEHSKPSRRDYLIEALTYNVISEPEAKELYEMLVPTWRDEVASISDRLSANILMRNLEQKFGFSEEEQ